MFVFGPGIISQQFVPNGGGRDLLVTLQDGEPFEIGLFISWSVSQNALTYAYQLNSNLVEVTPEPSMIAPLVTIAFFCLGRRRRRSCGASV